MKQAVFASFFFVLLPATPVFSETTQATLRLERPLQITASPSGSGHVAFAYSLDENWSAGLLLKGGGTMRENEIVSNSFHEGGVSDCVTPGLYYSYCMRSVKSATAGFLFLHYFPFDSPFLLGAYVGKGPELRHRYTELVSFTPGLQSSPVSPVEYTVTEDPYGFAGIGAGFRHVFSFGLVLGAEAFFSSASPHKTEVHITHDLRSLAPGATPLNLTEMWWQHSYVQSLSNPTGNAINFLMYAGFSF